MEDHNYALPPKSGPSSSDDVLDTLDTWLSYSVSYRRRSIAESTAKNVRLIIINT